MSYLRQKFIYVSFSNEISCWYSTEGKSPPVFGDTHSASWQCVDLFIYSLFLFLRIHKTLKLYIINKNNKNKNNKTVLSTFWCFHPCVCMCYTILIQVKIICLTECLSFMVEIFIIIFCCIFERQGSFLLYLVTIPLNIPSKLLPLMWYQCVNSPCHPHHKCSNPMKPQIQLCNQVIHCVFASCDSKILS